jgi:hypothetical protein
MTSTFCVYTVLRYSGWWTVDLSETYRVLYQINLRKVHLAGFLYKNISRYTVLWMWNDRTHYVTRIVGWMWVSYLPRSVIEFTSFRKIYTLSSICCYPWVKSGACRLSWSWRDVDAPLPVAANNGRNQLCVKSTENITVFVLPQWLEWLDLSVLSIPDDLRSSLTTRDSMS